MNGNLITVECGFKYDVCKWWCIEVQEELSHCPLSKKAGSSKDDNQQCFAGFWCLFWVFCHSNDDLHCHQTMLLACRKKLEDDYFGNCEREDTKREESKSKDGVVWKSWLFSWWHTLMCGIAPKHWQQQRNEARFQSIETMTKRLLPIICWKSSKRSGGSWHWANWT